MSRCFSNKALTGVQRCKIVVCTLKIIVTETEYLRALPGPELPRRGHLTLTARRPQVAEELIEQSPWDSCGRLDI